MPKEVAKRSFSGSVFPVSIGLDALMSSGKVQMNTAKWDLISELVSTKLSLKVVAACAASQTATSVAAFAKGAMTPVVRTRMKSLQVANGKRNRPVSRLHADHKASKAGPAKRTGRITPTGGYTMALMCNSAHVGTLGLVKMLQIQCPGKQLRDVKGSWLPTFSSSLDCFTSTFATQLQ